MSSVHEVEQAEERNRDIAATWTTKVAERDNSRPFRRWPDVDLPLTDTKWPASARVLFVTGSATALWALIFLMIKAF